MRKCQSITRLITESKDRKLKIGEVSDLGMHLLLCSKCRQFKKNDHLLSHIIHEHNQQRHH